MNGLNVMIVVVMDPISYHMIGGEKKIVLIVVVQGKFVKFAVFHIKKSINR